MKVLERVEKEKIRDFLGKGWLTHDGLWFHTVCREFGIEKANMLNKASIRALSVIETQRLKNTLGIQDTQFETFEGIHSFMLDCLELILPGSIFSRFHTSVPMKNVLHWEWESEGCFAYRGLKQIGLLDEYHCGVIYRIQCWFDALGVTCITTPAIEKCLMYEKGYCRGDFEFLLKG